MKCSRLARAAVGGIIAAIAGCGGAPLPAPDVPGAPPDEDTQGVATPMSTKAPAEKHACGGAKSGCSASMMPAKAQDAAPPHPSAVPPQPR